MERRVTDNLGVHANNGAAADDQYRAYVREFIRQRLASAQEVGTVSMAEATAHLQKLRAAVESGEYENDGA